jgi:hypothetical protein
VTPEEAHAVALAASKREMKARLVARAARLRAARAVALGRGTEAPQTCAPPEGDPKP